MIVVPHLEWHISHSCNFWNKRISPQRMVILGGEPLLKEIILNFSFN